MKNKYDTRELFRNVRAERRAKMFDAFSLYFWAFYPLGCLALQFILGSSFLAMLGYAVYKWLTTPSLNGTY